MVYPVQVDCTPTVIYSNGAEGAHNKAGTTAWPGPIAVAASWNLELNEQKGAIPRGRDVRQAEQRHPRPGCGQRPHASVGSNRPSISVKPAAVRTHGAANVRGIEDGGSPDKPVIANL